MVEITGDVEVSGSITASSAVVDTITSGKFRVATILTNAINFFPFPVDTITSGKFRVANILTNAINFFPFPVEVEIFNITIATGIICGGGTLLFHISLSAFNNLAQDNSILTFRLKNSSSTTVATIVMKHKFNNSNNIRSISKQPFQQ